MEKLKQVVLNKFGFYKLAEIPSQVELNDYYAKKYYQEDHALYCHEYSREELQYFTNKMQQKSLLIHRWMRPLGKKPSFLDVGCGEGFTLSFINRAGI